MPVLQSEAGPRAPPGLLRGNRCLCGSTVHSRLSMPALLMPRPGRPAERRVRECSQGHRAGAERTHVLQLVHIRLCWNGFRSSAASYPLVRSDHRRVGEGRPAHRSDLCVPGAVAPARPAAAVARTPVPTVFPPSVRFLERAARRARADVAAGRRPAIPVADRCSAEAAYRPVREPGRSRSRDGGRRSVSGEGGVGATRAGTGAGMIAGSAARGRTTVATRWIHAPRCRSAVTRDVAVIPLRRPDAARTRPDVARRGPGAAFVGADRPARRRSVCALPRCGSRRYGVPRRCGSRRGTRRRLRRPVGRIVAREGSRPPRCSVHARLAVGVVGSGVVGVHGSKLPAPVSRDRMDRRLGDLAVSLLGVGSSADRGRQFVDPRNRCRDRWGLLPTPTKYDDDGRRYG